MKLTTAVAIRGGVDSMTAALLSKQQGHHVNEIYCICKATNYAKV
jgi:tRNA U34 2-thiouridine synthase MnmA/TrmU